MAQHTVRALGRLAQTTCRTIHTLLARHGIESHYAFVRGGGSSIQLFLVPMQNLNCPSQFCARLNRSEKQQSQLHTPEQRLNGQSAQSRGAPSLAAPVGKYPMKTLVIEMGVADLQQLE